jgi:P pilus assembly chaperone PapD
MTGFEVESIQRLSSLRKQGPSRLFFINRKEKHQRGPCFRKGDSLYSGGLTLKFAALFLALSTLMPQAAWANRAEVMMIPTRVVMEDKDNFTTIVVKNKGNATGNFSIDLVDMTMGEEGGVKLMPEGQTDPYSAQPYLRVAPRSMTLKPDEAQNVRILLRKPEGIAPGEYRSHLKLAILNDNVEESNAEKASGKKESNIAVKINMIMIIPLIVRVGETTLSMKIEDAKIIHDEKGQTEAVITLLRDGNRSSMGDFTFTWTPPGGAPQVIKTFPGVPVYRSTNRRKVVILLNGLPAGVDLSKGKLDILYAAQKSEDNKKLAEIQIDLGG